MYKLVGVTCNSTLIELSGVLFTWGLTLALDIKQNNWKNRSSLPKDCFLNRMLQNCGL